MLDEVTELLDTAILKEIASQAFYSAAQKQTKDNDIKMILKQLEEQEVKHTEWLKSMKNEGTEKHKFNIDKISNLRMSEYLTGPDKLEQAGLQDILIFAIKREQDAIDYYSRMTGIFKEQNAKELCKNLVNEELLHKSRLETLYDDIIYRED